VSAFWVLSSLSCGKSADISVGGNRIRPAPETPQDAGLSEGLATPADSFVDTLGVTTHFGYPDSSYATLRDTIALPALSELGVRHIRESATPQTPLSLTQSGLGLLLVCRGSALLETVEVAKAFGATLEAIEGPSDTDYRPETFSYGGQAFPEGTRAYQNDLFAAFSGEPALAHIPIVLPTVYAAANAEVLGALESGTHCNVHSREPLGATPGEDADRLIEESRRSCGDVRPMMATSVSYSSLETQAGAVSELTAAKYLMRSALAYFSRGVERFYVYELMNEQPDPAGALPDLHRGLLRADGTRKPAFTALANLIAQLSDPGAPFQATPLTYGLEGQVAGLQQLLLQKRDGTFHLLLWQEVASWDPASQQALYVPEVNVELRLGKLVSMVEVFRPLESASAVSSFASVDRVSVTVPDHPIVVRVAM